MLIIVRIIIPNRRLSKEVILSKFELSTLTDTFRPEIFWIVTICFLLLTMIVRCNYTALHLRCQALFIEI